MGKSVIDTGTERRWCPRNGKKLSLAGVDNVSISDLEETVFLLKDVQFMRQQLDYTLQPSLPLPYDLFLVS